MIGSRALNGSQGATGATALLPSAGVGSSEVPSPRCWTSSSVSCSDACSRHCAVVLPADPATAVEAHLADCPSCHTHLDQLRATIGALGSLPVPTLSGEVCDALLPRSGKIPNPHRKPRTHTS